MFCGSNEVTGMTSKAFTNILKLAPIYSCGRQVVDMIDTNTEESISFVIEAEDVKAAFELVNFSTYAFQHYKVPGKIK